MNYLNESKPSEHSASAFNIQQIPNNKTVVLNATNATKYNISKFFNNENYFYKDICKYWNELCWRVEIDGTNEWGRERMWIIQKVRNKEEWNVFNWLINLYISKPLFIKTMLIETKLFRK